MAHFQRSEVHLITLMARVCHPLLKPNSSSSPPQPLRDLPAPLYIFFLFYLVVFFTLLICFLLVFMLIFFIHFYHYRTFYFPSNGYCCQFCYFLCIFLSLLLFFLFCSFPYHYFSFPSLFSSLFLIYHFLFSCLSFIFYYFYDFFSLQPFFPLSFILLYNLLSLFFSSSSTYDSLSSSIALLFTFFVLRHCLRHLNLLPFLISGLICELLSFLFPFPPSPPPPPPPSSSFPPLPPLNFSAFFRSSFPMFVPSCCALDSPARSPAFSSLRVE